MQIWRAILNHAIIAIVFQFTAAAMVQNLTSVTTKWTRTHKSLPVVARLRISMVRHTHTHTYTIWVYLGVSRLAREKNAPYYYYLIIWSISSNSFSSNAQLH